MNRDEEEQLYERFSRNDKGAFNQIYEKYAPLLYGEIIRAVDDQDIAEKILTEAFIEIHKSIMHFKFGNIRFYTWILQIVHERLRFHGFKILVSRGQTVTKNLSQHVHSDPPFPASNVTRVKRILAAR